ALELMRPDRRVDLGRINPRVAKKRSYLLQVVVLLEHLHGHAVPEIMRLELGHADQPTVRLAEPPDVLAVDRRQSTDASPARPPRPEERRVGRDVTNVGREHEIDIRLEELHDHRREWDISRLPVLVVDTPQAPVGV